MRKHLRIQILVGDIVSFRAFGELFEFLLNQLLDLPLPLSVGLFPQNLLMYPGMPILEVLAIVSAALEQIGDFLFLLIEHEVEVGVGRLR